MHLVIFRAVSHPSDRTTKAQSEHYACTPPAPGNVILASEKTLNPDQNGPRLNRKLTPLRFTRGNDNATDVLCVLQAAQSREYKMNRQSFHAMQVVKREEKETRMVQFILGEIAEGRVSLSGDWCIIALSMDSPVIKALRRVVHDLGSASDLRIQVVLTRPGKHVVNDCFASIDSLAIRTSQNSRLLDAHEQLVLGDASSWTGDCMRRDPRERDAFETFGNNNAELADWAMKSFERLWSGAQPLNIDVRRFTRTADEPGVDDVVAGDGAKSTTLVAATSRH